MLTSRESLFVGSFDSRCFILLSLFFPLAVFFSSSVAFGASNAAGNVCFYDNDEHDPPCPFTGNIEPATNVCESRESFQRRKDAVLYALTFDDDLDWPIVELLSTWGELGRKNYKWRFPTQAMAKYYFSLNYPEVIRYFCDSGLKDCSACTGHRDYASWLRTEVNNELASAEVAACVGTEFPHARNNAGFNDAQLQLITLIGAFPSILADGSVYHALFSKPNTLGDWGRLCTDHNKKYQWCCS